jgi:hypothetical protein
MHASGRHAAQDAETSVTVEETGKSLVPLAADAAV